MPDCTKKLFTNLFVCNLEDVTQSTVTVDGKSPATAPSSSHLRGIDGLRCVAAVSVLVGHVGTHLGRGVDMGPFKPLYSLAAHGLTLFFVLSGFLLYRPFIKAVLRGRQFPSVSRFTVNRLLRIYPAYIVVFLVINFAAAVSILPSGQAGGGVAGVADRLGRITDPGTILANLALVQTFIPSIAKTGIGPAWSLSVELTFYALLPVVAYLAWRLAKGASFNRRVASLLLPPLMLAVLGTVGDAWHASLVGGEATFDDKFGASWASVLYLSLLTKADLFAAGMLVALGAAVAKRKPMSRMAVVTWSLVLGVAGGSLAVMAIVTDSDMMMAGAVAAVLAVLTVGSSWWPVGFTTAVLEWLPIKYVGEISYSVYLWHGPVIWWIYGRSGLASSFAELLALTALTLGVTISLSVATYHLVERPAMSLKGRWGRVGRS